MFFKNYNVNKNFILALKYTFHKIFVTCNINTTKINSYLLRKSLIYKQNCNKGSNCSLRIEKQNLQ